MQTKTIKIIERTITTPKGMFEQNRLLIEVFYISEFKMIALEITPYFYDEENGISSNVLISGAGCGMVVPVVKFARHCDQNLLNKYFTQILSVEDQIVNAFLDNDFIEVEFIIKMNKDFIEIMAA